MVLEGETKITQSKNAHTQYITIPASIVRDSQYPFRANEKVKIIIDPYREIIMIVSVKGPTIRVSSEGIIVDKRRVEIIEK